MRNSSTTDMLDSVPGIEQPGPGTSDCIDSLAPCSAKSEHHQPRILQAIREIESLVDGASASWHTSAQVMQSRGLHRFAYCKPLWITPVDELAEQPSCDAIVVDGRDLSPGGVSFVHVAPLPYRIVVVTFQSADGRRASVLTRLNWCRFTRDGRYQSGGRFLRLFELPDGWFAD